MEYISKEKIKKIRKYLNSSFAIKEGKIIVEGINAVYEAFLSGYKCEFLIVEEGKNYPELKELCKTVSCFKADLKTIKPLFSTKTSYGIVALFSLKKYNFFLRENLLFLDNLQDPGNLGTLIRSAVAFGVKNVILSPGSVYPFSPKVIRSSAGNIFKIFVNRGDVDFNYLKKEGYFIYGTLLDKKSKKLSKLDKVNTPYVLVLGNEGRGISEKYLPFIDENIFIEQEKNVESLNVAVSGAIIMHRFFTEVK